MSGVQLRRYQIKADEMEAFLEAWRGVLGVRAQYGFTVVAAFVNADDNEFTWVVRHDGDFEVAEKDYYAAPERAALPANPAAFVEAAHVAMVTPVLPEAD